MLIGGAIAGGLSALGAAAGSSIGSNAGLGIKNRKMWKYTQKQMKLQQQYALEQMQKQYEYQLANSQALFDYQNAYNEPSKVLQRFLRAGINPAAVLGSSGANVQATPSASGTSAASVNPPSGSGFPGGSTPILDGDGVGLMKLSADLRNTNSDTDLKAALAEEARGNTHSQDFRERSDALYLAVQEADENLRSSGANEADARADLYRAQKRIADNDAEVSDWTLGGRIEAELSRLQIAIEDCKQAKVNSEYLRLQLNAGLLLVAAQTYCAESQGTYFRQMSNLTYQETIQLKNEIANMWDKKFDVEITNSDGSSRTESWSMQDVYNDVIKNEDQILRSDRKSAEYRAHNERYLILREVLSHLTSIATSSIGAGAMVRSAGIAGQSRENAAVINTSRPSYTYPTSKSSRSKR